MCIIVTCEGLLVAGQDNSPSAIVLVKAPQSIIQFSEQGG